MNVPLWAWFAVLGIILLMLAIDLFAHRKAHIISVKEAAAWSAVWVALGWASAASSGGGPVRSSPRSTTPAISSKVAGDRQRLRLGHHFQLLRGAQAVPAPVLFYGVLGALVFRGVFIAAGSALIASFAWIPRVRRVPCWSPAGP